MNYIILEARIEYNNGQLHRVTVLVDMTGSYLKPFSDVRAIFVTTKPMGGYMWLKPNTILTEELLQEVAGFGMQTVDRDEIFPKWKMKIPKDKTQI